MSAPDFPVLSSRPLDAQGAYNAILVTAEDHNGVQMFFVIRVAYGPKLPDGDDLIAIAEERARQRIAEGGFDPGVEERWLLTGYGWEIFE